MGAISVCANIILGIVLMGPLGHGGLALATSLASMLNLGLLFRALKTRLGMQGFETILTSVYKTIICSVFMGAAVWAAALFIIPSEGGSLMRLFFGLMGSIMIGLVLYGFFSLLLKSRELEKVVAMTRKEKDKA
jgi:putative peptidoglycan lipid II flippase